MTSSRQIRMTPAPTTCSLPPSTPSVAGRKLSKSSNARAPCSGRRRNSKTHRCALTPRALPRSYWTRRSLRQNWLRPGETSHEIGDHTRRRPPHPVAVVVKHGRNDDFAVDHQFLILHELGVGQNVEWDLHHRFDLVA